MEIKTTNEIIDDQFVIVKEKHKLRTINANRPREDFGEYRYKKWVSVDEIKVTIKKWSDYSSDRQMVKSSLLRDLGLD